MFELKNVPIYFGTIGKHLISLYSDALYFIWAATRCAHMIIK